MMNAERLEQAGIDYNAGVARFMGDKELYEVVLAAFLQDDGLERAQRAFDSGDRTALLACVHEVKGSSGNADMKELYAAACELVTLLRASTDINQEIADSYARFGAAYRAAQEGIRTASEG